MLVRTYSFKSSSEEPNEDIVQHGEERRWRINWTSQSTQQTKEKKHGYRLRYYKSGTYLLYISQHEKITSKVSR